MNPFFEKQIEKINLLRLVFIAFFWVVLFSCLYFFISQLTSSHLISNKNSSRIDADLVGFLEALYYSFTTMTTLGTGEYTPMGWLKLLTVLEVIGGLIIAGLAVNVIISIPSRRTRKALKNCTGWWLEQVSLPKDRKFYSFTHIIEDDGIMKKIGFNFDKYGHMDKTQYEGTIITSLFPTLLSMYKNDALSKDYTEGILKIDFQKMNGKYQIYTGGTYDKKYGLRDSLLGKRISDQEIINKASNGILNREDKAKVVKELFEDEYEIA